MSEYLLTKARLDDYRKAVFHTTPGTRLASKEEAVNFVNERGFIFFWPIQNISFPSLWAAVAGDRPVADEHDDPGHITWGWKDALLGKKVWYYGRVLRKKNTFISMEYLPYFYALSPNYGDPEIDYLDEYERGLMPSETRQVYEILLQQGALDSIALRRESRLSSAASNSRFTRALEDLQTSFRILPTGVADAGTWHYAFIYDCVHRHFPTLIEDASKISTGDARRKILSAYLRSIGAASTREMIKFFHWTATEMDLTIKSLLSLQQICAVQVENEKEYWYAASEIF